MIGPENFPQTFGQLFEYSPWVAQRAVAQAPFADASALHAAFMRVVHAASPAEQLSLIRAHPELGVKSVPLTQASDSEQTGAGLKTLSPAEYEKFARLNAAYREKFGFPFIICVRMHNKTEIFAAFERRLNQDFATEQTQALTEIGHITRLRLHDMLSSAA